jgi:hypothetical protein
MGLGYMVFILQVSDVLHMPSKIILAMLSYWKIATVVALISVAG